MGGGIWASWWVPVLPRGIYIGYFTYGLSNGLSCMYRIFREYMHVRSPIAAYGKITSLYIHETTHKVCRSKTQQPETAGVPSGRIPTFNLWISNRPPDHWWPTKSQPPTPKRLRKPWLGQSANCPAWSPVFKRSHSAWGKIGFHAYASRSIGIQLRRFLLFNSFYISGKSSESYTSPFNIQTFRKVALKVWVYFRI